MSDTPYSYTNVAYQMVDTSTVNLRAMATRYLRNWYWFVVCLAGMLVGAYFYLQYQAPMYKSQASLLIKDEKKGFDQEAGLKELNLFTPKRSVENEIEILKTFALMGRVVDQLSLNITYHQDTRYGKREIFAKSPIRLIVEQSQPSLYEDFIEFSFPDKQHVQIGAQVYPLNSSVQTPYGRLRVFTRQSIRPQTGPIFVRVQGKVQVTNALLKQVKAEAVNKAASVIQLSVETPVADKGEAILKSMIDLYTADAITDKNRVAANTLSFIEDRLKLISGELADVERGVESFKAAQGITDLGAQAQGFLTTVQENDAQLNQVNIQLKSLGDLETYLTKQPGNRGGTPATLGLSDPTLLGLIEKVNTLEAEREQLVSTTSEEHPAVQTLDTQIKTVKTGIGENVATMKTMLTNARKQYVSTNNRMEEFIRTIPSKERALLDITRQQSIKNNLYTYLLQKREETALSYASTISDSRTIDPARSNAVPTKPNKQTAYLLFGLIGLLLPISAMSARDALNNRVMRRADVEETTHVPILGEVVKKTQPGSLVVVPRSQSIIAEQIRTLRTNLQYLRDSREGSQVLLFTSSISGEGKSFISLNLGASLALVGKKTVILEMDLRKPRLRHALNFANELNAMGLSNYLIGEATVDEILQPIPGYDHYAIITSGPIPHNPSELLSGSHLEELIAELRTRFDYVIIDAPPVGLVTDAQLIAPFSDATLFMVRHDVTPKNHLKMIEMLYQEKRFNKLNVILNAVGSDDSQYYSYGYKGNGYNYGYGPQKGMLSRFRSKS
ncbi:MAG: polysaccharide biosynthesis tyrosine autokinase [Cytophagales bacterium]|nr:MAG: polysaccharide biosynthesis tyrosine autokinase [Cytophagales bacterium]